MSQRWDYAVEEFRTVDAGGLTQLVNDRAQYGWELISVNPPFHYFRRKKEGATAMEQPEQDEVYGARQT